MTGKHTALSLTILITAAWVTAAHAQPPQLLPKIGQCPPGYASSARACTPMPGTTRTAVVRAGQCPPSWTQSGAYCLSPPGRR